MRSWLEVLIVSGDYKYSHNLAEFVIETGAEPHLCSSVGEAQRVLQSFPICLVFSDRALPDGNFRDIIAILAGLGTRIPVVVYPPFDGWTERIPARRDGALHTSSSPYSKEEVEQLIAGLVAQDVSQLN